MKKHHLLILSLAILLVSLVIFTIANEGEAAIIVPVCCATEEGLCRDIMIKAGESGCGEGHDKYTFISNEDFCNQREECCTPIGECSTGTCYIRGKKQKHMQQKYACIALCKDSGECDCPGDLNSCTGDWEWEPFK
jgi:hypothetical protein